MCSVKPQNDLSHKGRAVEEWADLHFFRPIGIRIARALQPTGISADQVTLWSLVIGLVAGHLFAYRDRWSNVIGFVLFIVSDIFDSADGQLARLRGSSTRFGRALDGISDNLERQSQLFPRSVKLIRRLRRRGVTDAFRAEYRARQEVVLPLCAWLGQNICFVLVGVAAVAAHVSAFLWVEAVWMSLVLVVL